MISAGLDAMGGLAVIAATVARHMVESPTQRLQRFAKLGTIDLRVDYLRPGIGDHFELRRRGDASGLTRGLYPHGVFGCGRQAAVDRISGLHRVLSFSVSLIENGAALLAIQGKRVCLSLCVPQMASGADIEC